jgi:hypothetical protein
MPSALFATALDDLLADVKSRSDVIAVVVLVIWLHPHDHVVQVLSLQLVVQC